MTKNSNRKGLALGAIFALVSSLFVSAPAAQANEAGLIVEPIAGTSYTMVNTEDFILTTRLGAQLQADRAGALKYIIAKSGTVGYGLSISHTVSSTTVAAFPGELPSFNVGSTYSSMITTSTTSVVATVGATGGLAAKNQLRLQLWSFSNLTSASPAATVTVTAFLDLNGDNEITGTEPNTVVTVSFVPLNNMGASVRLTQPVAGDTVVTASASLTGVNHQQLGGSFILGFYSTRDQVSAFAAASASDTVNGSSLSAGIVSHSEEISPATASALVAQSVSAVLWYNGTGNNNIVASQRLGVANTAGFDGFTFSATAGDNLLYTGSSRNSADIRVNSPVSLEAWAFTGSAAAVSPTQATKWWVGLSGITLSTDKYIVLNGVTHTSSATLPSSSDTAVAVTAGTKGAITLSTFGFDGAGSEIITFNQRLGDKSASLALTAKVPTFTLTSDAGLNAVVLPGASTRYAFTVKDQFDVLSTRVNQRVAAYSFAASGFSTSETVSAPVASGKASVAVSTLPATATGSATVRATLQRQDENTGAWVNVSSLNIALTVTTSPVIFSAAVSPSTSPVSISYDVWSWSGDVTVTTNVAGAVVTVAAKDLVINDTVAKVTASDTLTARSGNGGVLTLKFAGKKAGTYTVSYTVGSTTTTSHVVVQAATVENASTVTLNSTTLTPGQTNVFVATLVDKNGNPIKVDDKVDLSYTGKGLPFNIGRALDTDADGKITFQVLVLAGETGTGTLTATIHPTNADKDDITVVRTLNIVTPAAPAVPEVNAVIGSFNNRVAVRVENAKGAAVSVKVGARWFKYTSLNDNYLWTVRSSKGRTLPVAVYVNGTLENVATITVK